MPAAFDMPCGARMDLYRIRRRQATYRIAKRYIDFAKQKYRVSVAHISTKELKMNDKKNQLREDSIEFAIAVSNICVEIKGLSVFVNQLLRSASSIGANIHEAKYAQSRADFINKLEIALKESSETEYWLELLYRKQKLKDEQYNHLHNLCGSIRRRLIASITTAKSGSDRNNH